MNMLGRQIPLKTARKGGYFFRMAQDGTINVTLDLGAYFQGAAPADLPNQTNWLDKAMDSIHRMYKNDTYGDCHDAETEVLTELGWQKWPDYDGTSLLGTMNPVTGMLEFQAPLAVKRREHDGRMAYSSHKSLDFAVTPNHRMMVRPYSIPYPYVKGGAGYGPLQFSTIDGMPTRSLMPGATRGFVGAGLRKISIGRRVWDGDDFMRLLALVISDGYVGGGETQRSRISFCCFREDRREMVQQFAHRVGITEQARQGVWVFNDAELAEWMRANLYTGPEYSSLYKRVPDLVKVAHHRQIEEFLKFFGDQSIVERGNRAFYSSSKRLIDDLQELLLKIGKRGSIYRRDPRTGGINKNGKSIKSQNPSYTLWEHLDSDIGMLANGKKRNIEFDHYKGEVFCATVPNSTLVTRRNGQILISGNCVIASLGHIVGVWTGNDLGTAVQATDSEIVAIYRIWNPRGDNGCDISTVNNYWRDHGVTLGGKLHKIDSYVSVDNTNWDLCRAAIALFANIKLGIDLPGSWEQNSTTWDVTNSRTVGGHDVPAIDYTSDSFTIATWGGTRKITKAAWTSRQYITEAYSILSSDWYNDDMTAPNGLDVATLKADLDAIAHGQIPSVGPPQVPLDWLI